jgi:hypothetical protein
MPQPAQRGTEGKDWCGWGRGSERPGGGWSFHDDPGGAVVTGMFGASCCSAGAAADSWPHPGLVDILNLADATLRGSGLLCIAFLRIHHLGTVN